MATATNSRTCPLYLLYVSTISGISATQVVQEVAQKLTITTLPRRLAELMVSPCMVWKLTSGALCFLLTDAYAAAATPATSTAMRAGLSQDLAAGVDVGMIFTQDAGRCGHYSRIAAIQLLAGCSAARALLRRIWLQLFQLGFRDVVENLDHFLHAAHAARHVGSDCAFALGHAAHQEDGGVFGHHLERSGRNGFHVHQASLDLGGDQGIVGARGVAGGAGNDQFIVHRLHAFDAAYFVLDGTFHRFITHFARQQDAAVEAGDVHMADIANDGRYARFTFQCDRLVFGLGAQGAAVCRSDSAHHCAADHQFDAAGE